MRSNNANLCAGFATALPKLRQQQEKSKKRSGIPAAVETGTLQIGGLTIPDVPKPYWITSANQYQPRTNPNGFRILHQTYQRQNGIECQCWPLVWEREQPHEIWSPTNSGAVRGLGPSSFDDPEMRQLKYKWKMNKISKKEFVEGILERYRSQSVRTVQDFHQYERGDRSTGELGKRLAVASQEKVQDQQQLFDEFCC